MSDIIEFPSIPEASLLEQLFSAMGDDEGGIKAIASLLQMDDNQFKYVSPAIMESFDQAFTSPDYRLNILQTLNEGGFKVEDILEAVEIINNQIDVSNDENLTDIKRSFLKELVSKFAVLVSESEGLAKRIISIPIQLCRDGAKLPTYATDGSAAMDVYSTEDYTIAPGETKLIPLGIKVNIPRGYALLIQPRSGMSLKTKLRVANTPGLIDCDYHEEIGVIIENVRDAVEKLDSEDVVIDGKTRTRLAPVYGGSYSIGKGERIAQMRLVEVPKISWVEVKDLGSFDSDHGNGFGSTGTK